MLTKENGDRAELGESALSNLMFLAKRSLVITYGELGTKTLGNSKGSRLWSKQFNLIAKNFGKLDANSGQMIINKYPYCRLITLLVVNKQSWLPSSVWDDDIKKLTGKDWNKLNKGDKRLVFEEVRAYLSTINWEEFSKDINVKIDYSGFKNNGIESANLGQGGGESQSHKDLKTFVKKNLKSFTNKNLEISVDEMPILSGDRIDVYANNDKEIIAIEVKSKISSEIDCVRGLYQTIKYYHILQAMESMAKSNRKILVVLVLESRPKNSIIFDQTLEYVLKNVNMELWIKERKKLVKVA